jgi:flagellar FliJ protein
MTRTQRIQVVQRTAEDTERQRAQRLAASEHRLAECQARLAELRAFQESYARELAARGARGIAGSGLRDYQTFLMRLAEAVRHQDQLVAQAREARDAEHRHWQQAAQRAQALTRMLQKWQRQERRHLDRLEQRESDERSQTRTTRSIDFHDA